MLRGRLLLAGDEPAAGGGGGVVGGAAAPPPPRAAGRGGGGAAGWGRARGGRRGAAAGAAAPTRTATAPEPPVRVVSAFLKNSMDPSSSMRRIMISLISRAVSQETTRPRRIWPSSTRLARSTMPLTTPRQALERSKTAARGEAPISWATRQAVAGSKWSRQTPA